MLKFVFNLVKNENNDKLNTTKQKKKYKHLIKHLNQCNYNGKCKKVEIFEIGKGSYGYVVKIERSNINSDGSITDKQFEAIKVIKKEFFNSDEISVLEQLKKINHQNILEYYEFKEDEKYCYIYTEYIDGFSIEKKLERMATNSLENHIVHSITSKLLDALYYIHNENIIHRDIKCSNIMISNSKGIIKIIDFGLSKLFQNESKNYSFIGTLNYIAPEVILCNNTASRKSDIWSLGCTIIEMVGGDLKKKIKSNSHQKEIPLTLTPSLKHFLNCCLMVDPSKRFSALELLNHQYITNKNNSNETILINESGKVINKTSELLDDLLSLIKDSDIQIINIIEIGYQLLKFEVINGSILNKGHYTLKYFNMINSDDYIKTIENINHNKLPKSQFKRYNNNILHFITNKDGITLNSYKDKSKDKIIPTFIIKTIIKQILETVLYLFDMGIKDLNISLNNIIIDNNLQIFLSDYISSNSFSSSSSSLHKIGCLILEMTNQDISISESKESIITKPTNDDQYFINFIQHCFLNNQNERDSIISQLEHYYLKKDSKNNNILYWDFSKQLCNSLISDDIDTIVFGSKYNKPLVEKIPNNITSIEFGKDFNQRILPGILNNSIKSITFGRDFNQILSSGSNISRSNKTEINFNGYTNQPVFIKNKTLSSLELSPSLLSSRSTPNRVSSSFNFDEYLWNSLNQSVIPNSCTELKLGYFYNHQLNLPQNGSLLKLYLSDCFNQPISADSIPKTVKYLALGDCFNQPLDSILDDSSCCVEEISFGSCFNQPLTHLPSSIRKISFGFWFNQQLTSQSISNLVSITFGDSFNQPIDSLFTNCNVLKELKFGFCFNFKLNNLPQSLELLYLGASFNKPLEYSLPTNLVCIKFPSNSNFNQPIMANCFSSKLSILELGDKYNKPILKDSIPINIKELYFGLNFEYPLSSYYQYNGADLIITKFDIYPKILKYSPKSEIKKNQIPPSVTRLELLDYQYDFTQNSIPESITSLILNNYINIESLSNITTIIDLELIYNNNNNTSNNLKNNHIIKYIPNNITSLKINNEYIIYK